MRLIIPLLILLTGLTYTYAQRSRVQIQDGTLVTDKGTLLRGAAELSKLTSINFQDIKQGITSIKDKGLNCLHLYAEGPDDFEPGQREAFVDSIVSWTREDSLYLVMTATWHKNYGTDIIPDWRPEIDFVREFWRYYAQKYKNETHIIFEICNEPELDTGYDSLTIAMEKSAYDTIRKYAPETHVLFMSYGFNINPDSAILDIKVLGEGIDWSNASIAAHGYGCSTKENREFIRMVQDSGYAVTITEVPVIRYSNEAVDFYANLANTRVLEEESVSYLHFLSLFHINKKPSLYTSRIESSEIRWDPDFGVWPQNLTAINYINPYEPLLPDFCDESSKGANHRDAFAYWVINTSASNDTYIAYHNLDFGSGADSFLCEFSFVATNSRVEVRLDSLNGSLAGTCVLTPNEWETNKTFSCPVAKIAGVHKIYLVFKSNSYFSGNINKLMFKQFTTSIKSNTSLNKPGIRFYPNPAHDYIRINSAEPAQLEIYSMQGQLLIKKKIFSEDDQIPVSNISQGSYVVKISNDKMAFSEILIIE